MQARKNGFTLIEVLITVTIIGVLSSLGVTSYVRALKNGRDGTRKSDISQIQQALVMYRYENGSYPTTWQSLDSAGYLSSKPVDPRTKRDTDYAYSGGGRTFCVCAEMELPVNGNATGSDCAGLPSPSGNFFCLKNP